MRVRYTLPALEDLDALLSYIEQQSSQGAPRVLRQIQAAEDLLALFPLAAGPRDSPLSDGSKSRVFHT